ncbi:immunoglobulin-like domain-containing protein [Paraclostridium sordellii]|uniref:immunoglobulin-like domain-containing protein n=4 Tax=Paraclostridium sordellii TaxID=1505 RepID=UPI0022E60115|nr:immunoglobulin-like domain-containing protein [Paeniclostridium sordellii]
MKKLRKPTTAMLLAVMIISNAQGLVVYANEETNKDIIKIEDKNNDSNIISDTEQKEKNVDTIKPELTNIEVNKKEVKAGEEVEITVEAKDEGGSGIKSVEVHYSSPITYKKKSISLTKDADGKYRGKLPLTDKDESGEWMVYYAVIYDNADNYRDVYNSKNPNVLQAWNQDDLSHCNFKLTGTEVDTIKPELTNIEVNKKEVKAGEEVEITVEAKDEGGSGIKSVEVHYSSPITYKKKSISLTKDADGKYRGKLPLTDKDESGEWMVYYAVIYDNADNYRDVYNSKNPNVLQSWNQDDLSHCNFKLTKIDLDTINPLEGSTVLVKNQVWSNKTINGDLYIGPEAVLTVSGNVKVTGNVYVLGALKINGGLTIDGTLYGTKMSSGGNPTLNNGTIVISGSNSIGSTSMSNYPVQDIPVRIDNAPLVATDGKIDIKGATVNVADMYIEGKKVDLDYKGRFDVKDINIGTKNKVTIEFKTVFGNTITKDYDVDNDQAPIVPINKVPEITASDVEIKVGEKFNPLSEVSAKDHEDGDITNNIEMIENTVDTSKAGVYKVVYKVTDSQGASKTKEIKVTVVQGLVGMNKVPEITASDVEIKVGEKFNPLSGISAKDHEDGDITNKIEVIENTVDTSKAGLYKVVYKVRDSQGASKTKEIKVNVVQGLVGMNKVPEITASDVEIKVGEKFNPLSGVSAEDHEDGDITNKIEIIENTVDTSKAGLYKVVYKVTDSQGATANKTINITVKEKIEFNDTQGHWAEKTINLFVEKGFINGYDDKTFKPDNSMTRAEFVKVVNNVFGYNQMGTEQFDDVNESDWFYSDICIGINMGYIKGKSKDKFAPNDSITRQEVAMILTNIMDNKDNNLDRLSLFKDGHQTDEWAKPSVEGAIESGYLNGYEDQTIRANGNITRAEAISMLSRVKK